MVFFWTFYTRNRFRSRPERVPECDGRVLRVASYLSLLLLFLVLVVSCRSFSWCESMTHASLKLRGGAVPDWLELRTIYSNHGALFLQSYDSRVDLNHQLPLRIGWSYKRAPSSSPSPPARNEVLFHFAGLQAASQMGTGGPFSRLLWVRVPFVVIALLLTPLPIWRFAFVPMRRRMNRNKGSGFPVGRETESRGNRTQGRKAIQH
jgi:hypothetical protein